MQYTVVSSAEYTYPDIWEYPSGAREIDVSSARGGFASFQLLFQNLETDKTDIAVRGLPEGTELELYALKSVMVERNEGFAKETFRPRFPERIAPYRVYDCLMPFDGKVCVENGRGGVYAAIRVGKDAAAGAYECVLTVNGTEIPMKLTVYAAVIPEESLKMLLQYSPETTCLYHHVEADSEEYFALEKQYLALMRRMRQNAIYTCGVPFTAVGENQFAFDFAPLIAQVERFEAAGMKYFMGPTVGWRRSWEEPTILLGGKIPAMSYEGYCYLTQYLTQLQTLLDERGWTERFFIGVSDEPNDQNCTEYRALCGLIRRIAPKLKLIDAMSYGDLHGALDIYVPLNSEYEEHREVFERYRKQGAELWHYVCCAPRYGGYVNRFMDYPLLATRYQFYGNFKYDLTGYLHWALNYWQPGQDPFEQNCPEHHNTDRVCFLPAGDTHIVYPGENAPWMSIRLEAQREGAEEYELFRALKKKNPAQAEEIFDRAFRSFKDVEYDPCAFETVRRALLEALS